MQRAARPCGFAGLGAEVVAAEVVATPEIRTAEAGVGASAEIGSGRGGAEVGRAEIAAEGRERVVLDGRRQVGGEAAGGVFLKNAAQVVDRLLQFLVARIEGRRHVVSDGCFLRCHKTTIPFETCPRRACGPASCPNYPMICWRMSSSEPYVSLTRTV